MQSQADRPPAISFAHALWEHYTVFDGLAGMRVEDIHQDRRGFIWVATADGGVSRFDGVHFDNFTCADGLPHLTVMAIAETEDGRLWFGTLGGGLAVYDGSGFQVYTTAQGLPADGILGLRPGPGDSLWVLTQQGVGRMEAGRCVERITEINGAPTGPVYDLAQDGEGRLWLATLGRGVTSVDGRRLRDTGPDGEERLSCAWKLAVDGEGKLWVAPKYSGAAVYVYCYHPGTGQLERVQADGAANPRAIEHGTRHLRLDSRGWVWVAHRGVLAFDGRAWQRLSIPLQGTNLADTRLTYEDREGNIWVGFWGGGLAFCDPLSVRRFGEEDGLPDAIVRSLAEDQEGRIWIGTFQGLACLEEERIRALPAAEGWPDSMVLSVAVDRRNKVWAGSDRGRVYQWDGQMLEAVQISDSTEGIKALCEGRSGRLWVGGAEGTWGWMEEGRFVRARVPIAGVDTLLEDAQSRLWLGLMGFDPALYWYEGEDLHPFAGVQGAERFHYVQALCQTEDGTLWVGTGTGLMAYREGQCRWFTVRDGLSENTVLALAADHQGNLWVGTGGGGACRFDGQGFQVVRLGNTPAENVVEAILVDHQGQVWFGTRAGLVSYHPGQTDPGVVIRQVLAGQIHRDPRQVSCPETTPEVRIYFQGVGFRSGPRQMRYRCRLLGLKGAEDWSAFTGATEAVYPRLEPGEYCFEVQAVDRDGRCSAPVSLPVRVTPDPREDHLEALGQALGAPGQSFIGRSPAIRQVIAQIEQVGDTEMSALILGETGTGKGLAARLLHQLSRRRDQPFLQVNCGSLSEGVITSELFGHEKGAFTGAVSRRLGRFELANGGTLFLDEIGDLPLDSQRVLLQVLEGGTFQRVGGQETIRVDVRVVAATNRQLSQAVIQGAFREDLFYRLSAFILEMPPLRARQEDIPLLMEYFVDRFARHLSRPVPSIQPDVLQRLQGYAWPGNVRELEHLAQRAVLVCRNHRICLEDLPVLLGETSAAPLGSGQLSMSELEERERLLIEQALEASHWVIYGTAGAARRLGIHPERLRSRMRKYGLKRPGR